MQYIRIDITQLIVILSHNKYIIEILFKANKTKIKIIQFN